MTPSFMRTLSATAFVGLLMVSATFGQGCTVEEDPGVCYTTGEFLDSEVSYEYAFQMCTDWVNLLLSNCVEVYGVPVTRFDDPYELQSKIGAFCGQSITHKRVASADGYPGYGDEAQYAYQIRHTCNFIDNPNYTACSAYRASAPGTPEAKEQLQASATAELAGKILKPPVAARKSVAHTPTQVRIEMIMHGQSFSNTPSESETQGE